MTRVWLVLAVCVAWGTFLSFAYLTPEGHSVRKRNATVVSNHSTVVEEPGNADDEEREDPSSNNTSRSRRLIVRSEWQWPKGIVPYIFLDDVDDDDRFEILVTQKRIEKYTCIRFVPWVKDVTKKKYDLSHEGHLNFGDWSGCWSHVGFGGSENGRNIRCCSRYPCTHEIGHALGFPHEHRSYKREGYLRPNFQNIDPSDWSIYRKTSPGSYVDLRYDMTSHMHYNPTGYSNNGWYTQTVLFRDLQPMLQNRGNVYYSWHALAHAYSCTEERCPNGAAVTCVNDGFVSYIDNSICACICPPGLDPAKGCSDVIKQVPAPTKWPGGTYALPSPTAGCPGDEFKEGSVQHTSDGSSTQSDTVHMKGEFTANSFKYDFCVKESSTTTNADTAVWGPGRYCILKKGDCPTGFESGYIKFDNLAGTTTTTSGAVPDGVYDADTQFDFCCRDDGFHEVPLKLPNTKPFILFRHDKNSGSCQEVDGMLAFREYLSFDNDNEGQYAYSPKLLSEKFIYCYYVPANKDCGGVYKLTKDNPTMTITSPGYPSLYPNNADCFWVFTAPEDSTILLDFDDFDIATSGSECEDKLLVRYLLLGENPFTYCRGPRHRSIRTVRNTLSLNLRTTLEGQRKGFKAKVRLVTPENHCYKMADKGVTYNGKVSFTRDRKTCLPWSETTSCRHHQFNPRDFDANLEKNYCRNPDNTFRPWCYTGVYEGQCDRDYCDVCQLESKFDNYPDCEELKKEGFCEKDLEEVRAGCARTCDTPNAPVTKVTTCSAPDDLPDADPVTTLRSSYDVGDTVEFRCKSGSDSLTRTCLTDGIWSPGGYVCGSCPSGWSAYNGNCYLYVSVEKNYADASSHCQALGAIVSPTNDKEELDFVSSLRDDIETIWIGGTDFDTEGTFKWSDGTPFTWTNWEEGQPNNYARNQDCIELYDNKEWNDLVCSTEYPFVCRRTRSPSHAICVDRMQGCEDILKTSPEACVDHKQFAEEQCRLTCGVCEESGTPSLTCPVAAATPSVILEGTTDQVSRGQVVKYRCKNDHVRESGHEVRVCLASGQLSGDNLVCEAIAASVTPSNNVDLVARLDYGDTYWAYLGDNELMRITRNGDIIQWQYYATKPGKAMMQLWRPRSDAGERMFEFIGQNLLDTKKTGRIEVLEVPVNDRLPAQPGDVIGIHYFDPPVGITFTDCSSKQSPQATKMSWINEKVTDMNYFIPGQLYQQADRNKCYIMSFRAMVGPVVTCDVPPAPSNAILETTTKTVRIHTKVTYKCKDGYSRLSGDTHRKCMGNGQLDGEELICAETSTSVTPSNYVDLIARLDYGDTYWAYLGDNELMRITRNGDIIQWQYYATKPGKAMLQLWRPRSDAGERMFEFIGQNLLDTKKTGRIEVLEVPVNDRLPAQPGDVIGIHYFDPPVGITFTECSSKQTPQATKMSWINEKVTDMNYFIPGQLYQQADRNKCYIMSFRAMVGPVVTCDVPPAPSNAILKTTTKTVRIQTKVAYKCKDGYSRLSGDTQRKCMGNGQLDGEELTCAETSTSVTPSNNVNLIARPTDGDIYWSYVGDNNLMRLDRDGEVVQWKFLSTRQGRALLQVWRPRSDVGSRKFEFIGHNLVDSQVTGQVDTLDVPEYERIQVKKGDVIGIYYFDPLPGMGFTECSSSQHPEASQMSWINTKVENPSFFVSGKIYDQADRNKCYIMSLKAMVGPARKYQLYRTNWLPLISRGNVGSAEYVYTGINANFRIEKDGEIVLWKLYSKYVGDIALQVWREVGTNKYSLVGQNIVKTVDNDVQVVTVNSNDRISVKAGQLIGVHYGKNKGGLCYNSCNDDDNPEAKDVSWMEPSVASSSSITPDKVFTFQERSCRIFSLTAFIKPVA